MFTIEQIEQASSKVKSGADFPQFIQDLKALGVTHYDTFVTNGATTYYGSHSFSLNGAAKYPEIAVNSISSFKLIQQVILIHQQGMTDYPTFCQQAATSGVEKWTTDIEEMTISYLDRTGKLLTVEPIELP